MFKIKHFNDLSLDEFYEIAKSRYEVFACEQKIFSLNDYDDIDKSSYHIFLKENGLICAYARIIPKEYSSYNDVSIGRVLVLSSHRRKGLAKQMMDCAIDFIKINLHENNITLSAQTYIKNLYLSCGFKEISEVYGEAGIEHIKMRL
ncbi:GNAT family N-acetyltransferase [Clostridioides difficile]|uniref:GNAT family N-acetyltransferase n=1 Tax=Clostridioides difficile TaxID=1496 RepID=UPI00038CDB1E|nr:GNAT family N-acetyltransferase [Clostridioides difficile]EGT4052238.1 GNAT family N-acetyltransferase [Clostridioides difficile]EGT4825973.1 GNAT family N-acetyltransferase [Clostridioides difficile]EGT5246869.1 GNAT family N-acetyltransferase [Clostridioides difficile]EGT5447607.1 GNAT family N-acetyltransferase [Clostridioides difficile]EII6834487.1 GNAT family N-acetyltransferase [Clostridioides difficile]